MEVTLENNYYAFSLVDGDTATVTVVDGSLEYSHQTGGPFRAVGTIRAGESLDFDVPGLLLAFDKTRFDIVHPQPPPTQQVDGPFVPDHEANG
jgi:hypothetical protein